MNNVLMELNRKFNVIHDIGWIQSLREGSTGVGYTFETLLGKPEDSNSEPDYNGIEIKTHRSKSTSHISLFNCVPKGNSSNEVENIYNKYSYLSIKDHRSRVLNSSVYFGMITDVGIQYKFSLSVDEIHQIIRLLVFDRQCNLIDNSSYWSFDCLMEKLYKKLSYLAFICAKNKFIYSYEFFRYEYILFYKLKGFDTFIDLIKNKKIRVTFKIGRYKSGSRIGDICNHGVSFDIKSSDLNLLFDLII